jgi:hypothetical protein
MPGAYWYLLMVQDHTVPLPDTGSGWMFRPLHEEQTGKGGCTYQPQSWQRAISNSPLAPPDQNAVERPVIVGGVRVTRRLPARRRAA